MIKNTQSGKNGTVSFHQESEKNVLCFRLNGFVTGEDHKKFLVDPVRKAIKKDGKYRIVMIYEPTFEGWEPEAAQENMDIMLECMSFCERAAYVNPPKKKILQMKISEPLIDFDIRYFESGQLDEALVWIKQDIK